jgi:hypothetical protein
VSGSVLTSAAQLMCGHGGTVQITPGQSQVLVGGSAVVTTADSPSIAGACTFATINPAHPCTILDLSDAGSSKVTVHGNAVVLQSPGSGSGLCLSAGQLRQGPPTVLSVQQQVVG